MKKREKSRRRTPDVWTKKLRSDCGKADFRGRSSNYVLDILSVKWWPLPSTGFRSGPLDEWMSRWEGTLCLGHCCGSHRFMGKCEITDWVRGRGAEAKRAEGPLQVMGNL